MNPMALADLELDQCAGYLRQTCECRDTVPMGLLISQKLIETV